jgi:hypothetical protein
MSGFWHWLFGCSVCDAGKELGVSRNLLIQLSDFADEAALADA